MIVDSCNLILTLNIWPTSTSELQLYRDYNGTSFLRWPDISVKPETEDCTLKALFFSGSIVNRTALCPSDSVPGSSDHHLVAERSYGLLYLNEPLGKS